MSATGVNPAAISSRRGCADREAGHGPGWWFHLRRRTRLGHVGCCDGFPPQHSSCHAAKSGQPAVRSFGPGEEWFRDHRSQQYREGPRPAAPQHPLEQPAPGPADGVSADRQRSLR